MENMSVKNRIRWIDQAKGTAIFLMILGHCITRIPAGPFGFILQKVIYSFHMPLFLILSGFTFSIDKWNYKNYTKLLIRRLILIFLFVIAYFIFWGVLKARILDVDYQIGKVINAESVFRMFIGYGDSLIGPFWFIYAITVAEGIFILINKVFRSNKLIVLAVIAISLGGYIFQAKLHLHLPFCFEIGMTSIIFLGIGLLFNKYSKNIEVWYMLPICLILYFFSTIFNTLQPNLLISMYDGIYNHFFLFLISGITGSYIIIFFIQKLMRNNIFSFLSLIGKGTLGIYGLHYIVLDFISIIIKSVSDIVFPVWSVILISVLILFFTLSILNVVSKIGKIGNFILMKVKKNSLY